jgi:hypothetical protein
MIIITRRQHCEWQKSNYLQRLGALFDLRWALTAAGGEGGEWKKQPSSIPYEKS